jgi:hypothetical protein
MFLIFGNRVSDAIINVVVFVCGYCGVRASQNVIKRSNRFTLFFIPLFSFSTKYVNECSNCGGQTPLSADQARHSLSWSQSHP